MIHDEKPTLEEALEHFGVKGMQWGVRNAVNKAVVGKPDASGVTRKDKRAAYRQSGRTRDRAIEDFHDQKWRSRDADIKSARAGLKQANRDFADTSRSIKAQRTTVGKNASKIALREARNKNYLVNHKAMQDTTGEAAVKTAMAVGLAVARGVSERQEREAASASVRSS